MFTQTDYDKLRQIMAESPQKKELLTKLLSHHQIEISSISHEIRNPLTLVYSTLQLIETQHPEVLTFAHWESLHQDIEYMNLLLKELSTYNNSERLSLGHLCTESFLKSIVLSFAASIAETDTHFTSKIEPGLPDIYGDATKLRQVLFNLLQNAQDAVTKTDCSENHPAMDHHSEISFHAYTNDKHLLITITDNGCGIHPENIRDIFEPFVTYKKNGTGLGLPIARRIAMAHGGSLTASSTPRGASAPATVFTLSLPI